MEIFGGKTTQWKRENGLRTINFNITSTRLLKLDSLKTKTGFTRTALINDAIDMLLAYEERKAYEAYKAREQNRNRKVNTGLLPDY